MTAGCFGMEFKFDISSVLRKPISVFTADSLPRHPALLERVIEVIDELGVASAKAQGLRGPVTTSHKLRANPTHRVYVMKSNEPGNSPPSDPSPDYPDYHDGPRSKKRRGSAAIGIVKVGIKSLFLVDEYGRHLQVSPLCVLDFYVHEDFQRQGCGRKLFDYMLTIEMQRPGHLAYDRPSPKLTAFLKKHYGLSEYIHQPNNFVVYKEYGLACLHIDRAGRPTSAKRASPLLPKGVEKPPAPSGSWQVSSFRRKVASRDQTRESVHHLRKARGGGAGTLSSTHIQTAFPEGLGAPVPIKIVVPPSDSSRASSPNHSLDGQDEMRSRSESPTHIQRPLKPQDDRLPPLPVTVSAVISPQPSQSATSYLPQLSSTYALGLGTHKRSGLASKYGNFVGRAPDTAAGSNMHLLTAASPFRRGNPRNVQWSKIR